MHNIPLCWLLPRDKMCKITQKDSGSVLNFWEILDILSHTADYTEGQDNEDDDDNDGDDVKDEPVEDDEHDGDHAATHPLNHQVEILSPSLLLLRNTGNIF